MQPLSFLELTPACTRRDSGGLPGLHRGRPEARVRRLGEDLPLHSRSTFVWWAALWLLLPGLVYAHGVAEGDANFIQSQAGFHFWPYFYLGAKHMVTGYDHLLFLAGVIFFLYRLREIGVYVTLFAIGHSLTLIVGVWFDVPANVYLIDAIIGLSVVYKAFENIGGFAALGININTKIAVWVFGLFHGFGLATKLQALSISDEGLLGNLIAFNVGVEAGQLAALAAIVTVMNLWRYTARFNAQAVLANSFLMTCGFVLMGYQLTGYFLDG